MGGISTAMRLLSSQNTLHMHTVSQITRLILKKKTSRPAITMSSRTRGKRAAVSSPQASISAVEPTPRTRRVLRGQPDLEEYEELANSNVEGDGGDEDAEGEDAEEEDDEEFMTAAEPPKRSRGRPKGSTNKRKAPVEDGDTDLDQGDEDDETRSTRRGRESVSYKEIPIDDRMDGDEDEASTPAAVTTPRRRGRPPKRPVDDDDDDDKNDTSYKKEKIPGGSGRGGFSVKGAAAAAARARWEKVRRERAERGEDDTPKSARRSTGTKKHAVGPPADYKMGATVSIKNEEYTVGDDELIIPDDPKGDTKIDAAGRLQGDREYKLVTFTSVERRNPERIYALTIDAARACGYSDSLAFLRRYPTVLKLSCTAGERVKLIDLGRISGNLKHRQVTMVAMRNVFKVMGSKVIKNGRHVVDDYYEDEAAAKCAENGIEPGSVVQDEEYVPSANVNSERALRSAPGESSRSLAHLSTFYTVGGPTTHFAGNGVDPWTDSGWGNKRSRLRTAGVTEEDWMLRTAEEARAVDEQLRKYRDERLKLLEGVDALRGWVFAAENATEGTMGKSELTGETADVFRAPLPAESKKSGLSHEVTMEDIENDEQSTSTEEALENEDADVPQAAVEDKEAVIIEEPGKLTSKYNWGLGKSWQPGAVRAAYEPHTNMPHIPLFTQPTIAFLAQTSPYPVLSSSTDTQHLHCVQSTITRSAARGLASVEYVLETDEDSQTQQRLTMVEEAEKWERRMRAKKI
ncbi:chromatin structure-remodeling complex protein RSC7 [Cryptococcus neoformans Tu401-1]|nr:chromatin structure-remodeling complex protein RSC7 [Cryptococcus neoformans var. grubii Tu401-1]